MGKLRAKFVAQFGHDPSEAELDSFKERRAEKRAAREAVETKAADKPSEVTLPKGKVLVIVQRARLALQESGKELQEKKTSLVQVTGASTARRCIVTVDRDGAPDKSIGDVRQLASDTFGAANGWQIFLGTDVLSATFIGGQDGGSAAFIEEFKILVMMQSKNVIAFAVECLKGHEAIATSKPMAPSLGMEIHASAADLHEVVDEVVQSASSASARSGTAAGERIGVIDCVLLHAS
jgi:hypothetical protein